LFNVLWTINKEMVKQFIRKNFFAPHRFSPSPNELALANEATTYQLRVHEQLINCWKWDSAPYVVFVHGWNGGGLQFSKFIHQTREKGYGVIAFDGPGHGSSEGNTSSYFEMTDAVRAVLRDQAKADIIGLVGHSFGAAAIVNALEKEDHAAPAVLIAPALGIKEMLYSAFSMHGVPLPIFYHLINEYQARYGYHLDKDNPKNLLTHFNLNALIIHDRDDKITPFSESDKIVQFNQAVTLHSTTGLGHKKVLFDPQVIEQTLIFLKQIRSGNNGR
jgi:pimeloyl-ACP methyl ester carboxylesterase